MAAMRRLPMAVWLALMTAVVILGPSPALAPADDGPGRATTRAIQGFARATVAFHEARSAAGPQAQQSADSRRLAGTACLDVLRASPRRVREQLLGLYFAWVSDGLWQVDAPLFEGWIRSLGAVTGISRVAALRDARFSLALGVQGAAYLYAAGRDVCAPARAWQAAGWRADGRPPVLIPFESPLAGGFSMGARSAQDDDPRGERLSVQPAVRLLRRRGGRSGRLAARFLAAEVDEPDERVIRPCDAVVAVLDPTRARCPG
jgi:hypothetical protein